MRLVKALVGGVIGAAISAAIIVGVGAYYLVGVPDWLALVAGVVTGLGVRLMGKSDKPGPCYLCGAMAALLTLAAFFLGTQAATRIMESSVENTQIALRADSLPEDMKTPPPPKGLAEEESTGDTPPDSDAEPATEDDPAEESPGPEDPAAESDPAATTGEDPAAEPGDEPAAETEVVEEEVEEAVVPAEATQVLPPVVKVERPKARAEEFNVLSFVFIAVGALIAYEMGRSCGCSKPAA